jgi:hypothetical protein
VASAIRYVVEELSGDERPRAMVYTPTGSLFINKIEALYETTLNVPGPLTAARATAASSELSDESGGRIAGSRLRERANHIRTRTVMRDGSL